MAAFTTIAAIALATAGVASQVSSNRQAKKAGEEQKQKSRRLEAEARGRDEDAEKIKVRDSARNRQRALAQSAQGFGSTVLTGPLGQVGPSGGGGSKSLLGE
jgi:hypothetical protein